MPRPSHFSPRKKPGTHCTGGQVGPSLRLDECGKSHPPVLNPWAIQSILSCNTYYAMPAHDETWFSLHDKGRYTWKQFELCAFSINCKNIIFVCVCVCVKKIWIHCHIKLHIMPVRLTKVTTVFMYLQHFGHLWWYLHIQKSIISVL